MRLPGLAIRNHQFTLVIVALFTTLGLVSFFTMPRSEDPQFEIPTSRVIVVFPGASPEDIESLVVDPLEEQINEIEDIKKLETTIEDGVAVTVVEFFSTVDPDESHDEVVQAVSVVQASLPTGVAVETMRTSPSDTNILQLALSSPDVGYRLLQREAERLEAVLERVPGVKRASVLAFPAQEVRVAVDLGKLGELGIPLGQVIRAIEASAQNIPGGSVDVGGKRFNIRTSGDYGSLSDIARTIVTAADGERIVYLRDVATVHLAYEDETHRARVNSGRAVFVTVVQREESNIFRIMAALEPQLADFERSLPAGITLHRVFDQSAAVRGRLNLFFGSLLQGMVLVGLVVFVTLGVRSAVIVLLAIPIALLIAVSWVDFTGYGLQQISIVGLVIALGLLVDNAIVVTENVARFMAKGMGVMEAAAQGTAEVGLPVVSATITSVLAFLPIVFVQSTSGDFIRSLPVTVIYALIASLLISLTLTPLLASRFMRSREERVDPERDSPPVMSANRRAPNAFRRILDDAIRGPYRRTLSLALQRPVRVMVLASGVFLASFSLFPLVGVSLFPKAEKPQFLIDISTPEGASLDRTDAAVRFVEALVDERDEVVLFAANVGRDNPRVYYNSVPRRERSTVGQVLVELESYDDAKRVIPALRNQLDRYPGADFRITEFENGPPVEAPIAIKVIGPDLDILSDLAAEVARIMRETPGTTEIDNPIRLPRSDLKVDISRDKAGLLGVPLVDIDRTVRAAVAGLPIATYRDAEGEDMNVVVRLPFEGRPSVSELDRVTVSSVTGSRIPLRQLASVGLISTLPRIDHFGMERAATVTADVVPSASEFEVTAAVVERLEDYSFPFGYRYFVGGKLEAQEESFSSLTSALVFAVLGIIGVLVLQFRSFRQPLIIFVAVPLAVVGAILALLVTGYTFSFTAFIGLTGLVGIVINNSIILVDYANRLRAEGMELIEAVQVASETRFTPIVVTSLTTIAGLLPLTLTGSSLWSPLGWVIIGGLIVSTLLTLIVVPVLYKTFTPREPAAAKMHRRVAGG